MKTITPDEFEKLPLHDSELSLLESRFDGDRNLIVALSLEINPEESVSGFADFDDVTRLVWLEFIVVLANIRLVGTYASPVMLLEWYQSEKDGDTEYRIEFSSGAQIQIVAKALMIGFGSQGGSLPTSHEAAPP